MRKLVLGLLGCLMLSGCMRATLVAEDRDGFIVFLRGKYLQRDISDVSAEEYCQRYQKPATWLSTEMKKTGNYHDTYKCGYVPPAQMALERQKAERAEGQKAPIPVMREDDREEDYRRDEKRNDARPISGDYFGSRRSTDQDNNW